VIDGTMNIKGIFEYFILMHFLCFVMEAEMACDMLNKKKFMNKY